MEIFNKLNKTISKIINLKVSKVIAGGSNGSTVIIDVDKGYSIFIFCSWRYISKDNIVVTWNDSSDALKGKIPLYLKSLLNLSIKKITIINQFDLHIKFSNDAVLIIFSDLNKSSSSIDENWCFADIKNNECYNLTNEFKLTISKFDESR